MSLKAKIEAVIYASEEPVTLAQLAGLLGHEAQAELDHLDATRHALALEEAGPDEDELNSEVLSDAPQSETEAQHAEAVEVARQSLNGPCAGVAFSGRMPTGVSP